MPKALTKISQQAKQAKDNESRISRRRKALLGLLVLSISLIVANLWEDLEELVVVRPLEESRKATVIKAGGDGDGDGDGNDGGKFETPKTTPPVTTNPEDANTFEKRQKLAKEELVRLEAEGVLTTNFSSRETVLRVGFPRIWNPCALENAYQQTPKLNVVVLGGSVAARPGDNCTDSTNPGEDARYSALLERKLHADLNIQVENWAEGATSSLTRALRLDGVIDPTNTRVIVADFLINDNADSATIGGGQIGRQWIARKLDLFLTRIKVHYALAQQSPPAIVLMYLWQFHGDFLTLTYPILESYRKLGWEIALISVWPAFDAKKIGGGDKYRKALMDDGIHPNCAVNHLMADMLQHLFYSNLAACTIDNLQSTTTLHQSQIQLPPHNDENWTSTSTPYPPLFKDLFREDVKVGSISAWDPQPTNRITSLNMENLQEVSNWTVQNLGRVNPGRMDRKSGFLIPTCSSNNNNNSTSTTALQFHLKEPDLAWIGLNIPWVQNVLVTVNEREYPVKEYYKPEWGVGNTHVSHWLPIPPMEASDNNNKYIVKLCASTGPKAFLSFLVGVLVPRNHQATLLT